MQTAKLEKVSYSNGVGFMPKERLEEAKKNPEISVINPGERASSKHNFIFQVGGQAYKFRGGLVKMQEDEIIKSQDPKSFVQKDSQGKMVKTVKVIAETGQMFEHYKERIVNEDGADVAKADVSYYNEAGEKMVMFSKSDDVEISKFIPRESEGMYVLKDGGTYEVAPDSDGDTWPMWQLAKFLIESGQIATGIVVQREGWNKYGMLLVPQYDEDKGQFAIIAKLVRMRIRISHPITIPLAKPEEKKKKEGKTVATAAEGLF